MSSSFFYPLANAYPTYGEFELPGPGVRPLDAPLANHIDMSFTEADEIEYPVEAAYRTSIPMYESQLGPYPPPPNPSPPPLEPVGVNLPPRSFREPYANAFSPLGNKEEKIPFPPQPQPHLANNVLDYNKLQGTNNPTDLSIQIDCVFPTTPVL